ncbi:hypothetical protein D3C76_670980 [compost metagenome]
MRILDFLHRMVASFTKDELKEKLRILSQAMQKSLETFMNAEGTLNVFKSKAGKQFEADMGKTVRLPPRMTPIAYIRQVLTNMSVTLELLSSIAEKSYGKDIVVEGITYRRAELLRTIGYMDFVVSYSMQLLHYLLVAEASVTSKEHAEGAERPRPELAWLKANQLAFFTLLMTFSKPSREIASLIESIPDIVIGEDDDKIIAPQVGILKLDPLKNNFIPGVSGVALAIGIWWSTLQVAKYERLKEDARSIQLRLEQLRLQNQGKNDAQLERTISKYEGYLNDTAEKIAKMEAKYA